MTKQHSQNQSEGLQRKGTICLVAFDKMHLVMLQALHQLIDKQLKSQNPAGLMDSPKTKTARSCSNNQISCSWPQYRLSSFKAAFDRKRKSWS
jgi:hypothetical protein